MCTCMYVLVYVCIYGWVRVLVVAPNSLVQSELGNEKFRFVPVWTRYTGDSKIDSWDDLEIRIGSCNEDQKAIQF